MVNSGTENASSPTPPEPKPVPRWMFLLVTLAAVLSIMIPYIAWRSTWFGARLSDGQIRASLAGEKPRDIQHALEELSRRLGSGDPETAEFFPLVLEVAKHEEPTVRLTSAWFMGDEGKNPQFREALLTLIADEHPGVRHNAALGLSRFNDPAARDVLVEMLEPTSVSTPHPGTIETLAREGKTVRAGERVATVISDSGETRDVTAPTGGKIENISATRQQVVNVGDHLCRISPEKTQLFEALRALYLVGNSDDIPAIEPFSRQGSGVSEQVRLQAEATLKQIRARDDC